MNFLLVIFPFAAAFLLYLPLSARLSFPQYVHEEDSTERERFSNHAFAVLLARRIELYATVTSVAAVVVSLFVFRDPAFAGSVRLNLIISIIAVALALLAVVFRHSVDTLVARLMALERCIIIVILSCCEDEDDASAMSAFALFAIEELFSLRMQLKLLSDFSKGLVIAAPFNEICEDDITDLFSRSLSVFCGYLQNIRNPLKSSFAQSQPAYQMLLDLSDPI